jgi:hypothetical protein
MHFCGIYQTMEVFQSTTFFPTARKTEQCMSKQQQCIHSGLPVFAKDILDGGKKTYFACGYEHFCNVMYRNNNLRHVYELLQFEKPTKIYIDFDCEDVSKVDQFKEEYTKFCAAIQLTIGDENVPFYSLDASTDKKLSCHVIFELFLENVPEVQNVIEHTLTKCPCEFVDRSVYTRNRVFRLLYSYKLNKDPSTKLSIKGITNNDYNPEHVFRTLIQAMVPQHYIDGPFSNLEGLCKTVKQLVYGNNAETKHYHGSGYTAAGCNIPPDFATMIQEYGGVLLSCRENENFISCIVGGKNCPWSDKPHKNNNQYFTLCKSNLMGFWQCADKDCANIQYEQVDWSALWMKVFN